MNMDDLIVKYCMGAANADETTRIERWLAADERNRERLRQFRTLWDMSGRTAVSARLDTQEALGRLRQRLRREEEWGNHIRVERAMGSPGSDIGRLGRGVLAAAAVVGLLCVGIVIFTVMRRSGNSGVAGIEKTAKTGGTAIVGVTVTVAGKDTLPDGSVVTLAPHSKFIYTPGLTGDNRTISLEGDADFSVVSDPARPFVVLTGDIAVRVLGTSFLVRSGSDSTTVNVTTGVVEVSRDKDSVIVRAGERLTVFGKKKEMVLRDGGQGSEVWARNEGQRNEAGVGNEGREVKRKGKKTEMEVKGGNDQKQVMRSIIDDLVKEGVVPDKDSVEWFGLDSQRFVVNGRVMPVRMRQAFTAKYIRGDGMGYYFEAEKGGKVCGTGYFFDRKDLY